MILDASLALAWVLREREHAEETAALAYVAEHGAHVPGNFQTELAQALLHAERKKRITEAEVAEALSGILALPLAVEVPDVHVVVSMARTYGLTCYDASYLALAMQMRTTLATSDEYLRKAAATAKALWRRPPA